MKPKLVKPHPILKGCLGLNTLIAPARIPVDYETLTTSLAEAVDVEIDDSNRVSRRKGYVLKLSGNFHSLFCDGGDCLFVDAAEGSLKRLNTDYSYTGIRSGINPYARMWYVQVGSDIFYSNGYQNGRYNGGASYAWVALPYVGPTTTKTFTDPPLAKHLAHFNGRIYMSVDDTLWFTEPFSYSWVDMARNFLPIDSTPIRMIRSVVDGLYISSSIRTYFVGGSDVNDLKLQVVAEYPAVEGTDCWVDGSLVGDGLPFRVAMWTATTGICMGTPGGRFQNLTDKKIVLPPVVSGAGGYINQKYIVTMEP